MKLIILMTYFTLLACLATSFTESKSTAIESNSISVENLNLDNLEEHSSRIQRRSLGLLFGLKPRYGPIISVNWRKSNQQTFANNNHFTYQTTYIQPTNFYIQKNLFFYNGMNHPTPEPYPSERPTFSKTSIQQTESTPTTRFVTSTEATLFSEQSTKSLENSQTTRIYQSTASTTLKPQTTPRTTTRTTRTTARTTTTTYAPTVSRPQTTSVFTSTEPTISKTTNNIQTMEGMKGGFTSTSMPQSNEYSELIYDIDPRYRRYY